MKVPRWTPEAAAWAVGVVIRVSLFWGFNPRLGYDTNAHTMYMAYIAQHGSVPPIDLVWTANHPPLYYGLCAGLAHLGAWPQFEVHRLQVLSVSFAILRLAVLWWGLRVCLRSVTARTAALLLAAVLPCAVHGDGMVSNETLNALAATLAIVAAYRAFGALDEPWPTVGWRSALLVAVLLIAMMTKISGLLVAAAVAMGLVLNATRGKVRLVKSIPVALGLVAVLAMSAPVYGRHRAETGLWLPTSFERNEEARRQQAGLPPYFSRRPPSYYVGASFPALLARPYYDTVVSEFPMVLLATTYTDYYNYSFVTPPPGAKPITVNHRPLAAQTIHRMRISLIGGLVISLTIVVAYFALVYRALRRWNIAELVALSIPAAGVLGQLHYATKYPFDYMGLVKGLYLQFAWAPLFVSFGVAFEWGCRERLRWPLAISLGLAGLAVAQYTVHGVFEW